MPMSERKEMERYKGKVRKKERIIGTREGK
jgi:hypothetical protein